MSVRGLCSVFVSGTGNRLTSMSSAGDGTVLWWRFPFFNGCRQLWLSPADGLLFRVGMLKLFGRGSYFDVGTLAAFFPFFFHFFPPFFPLFFPFFFPLFFLSFFLSMAAGCHLERRLAFLYSGLHGNALRSGLDVQPASLPPLPSLLISSATFLQYHGWNRDTRAQCPNLWQRFCPFNLGIFSRLSFLLPNILSVFAVHKIGRLATAHPSGVLDLSGSSKGAPSLPRAGGTLTWARLVSVPMVRDRTQRTLDGPWRPEEFADLSLPRLFRRARLHARHVPP